MKCAILIRSCKGQEMFLEKHPPDSQNSLYLNLSCPIQLPLKKKTFFK